MKLTVIGAGKIGAGVAYNVAIRDVVDEINIVDLDEERAQGEALDIAHAAAYESDTTIEQASYDAVDDSDIVAVTAGKPRKEGMSRTDLMEANIGVMQAIHENDFGGDATFVTTTNPMDVINYTQARIADYPRERFVGFGGWLDSARMRYVLGDYLDVLPNMVSGVVMGEHGDSQVPVFSKVSVDGHPADIPEDDRDDLKQRMRQSAMDVISRKGATQWAPTYGVAEIVAAIATNARQVVPCSVVLDGEYGYEDVSVGVPAVIGSSGVERVIEWELDDREERAFDESVRKLQDLCGEARDML